MTTLFLLPLSLIVGYFAGVLVTVREQDKRAEALRSEVKFWRDIANRKSGV